MSATFEPLGSSIPRPTLASAALPPRVRRVLEHLYALVSDEMSRQLEAMLGEFEQQLFKHADLARNPAQQASHLETLRTTRLNRADLVPRYLALVESELTTIRDPVGAPVERDGAAPAFRDLKLVEHGEVDESLLLRTIAARQESRAGLPLLLLGQRFGVLAGQPAFDAERLPVGPYALGKILSDAAHALQISPEARMHLYKVFDHQVMTGYAQLVETMNALLARENVLPSLSFVPIRPRSPQRQEGQRRVVEPNEAADSTPRRQRPMTAWPGQLDGSNAGGPALESETFNLLQQLLAARRDVMGRLRPGSGSDAGAPRPTLTREELVNALSTLQDVPLHQAPPRNLTDVRQTLLAQARQQRGEATFLSRDDADTFELLDLFYSEIGRELRSDAAVGTLLNRLQVPLVRLALQDRGFFVRNEHPARQLLNAVAEAGAHWVPKDESDPQLNDQLRRAVDHVVENYDGDNGVFENANRQLQEHLRSMARKAEVAERRHVEAARGKEKLVLAKRQASEAIDDIVSEHKLPRFVQTLLSQAWTDVLTLTLLRSGEDSEEWQRQLEATREIVAANAAGQRGQVSNALGEDIEAALTQVGYHVEDAGAISRQLVTGTAANDDAASRTELALKLKARTRLGTDEAPAPRPAERSPKEQECWRHLRTLPFGTWFEFDVGDSGEVVRRRLSWFSPVTDNALFVNQRGQRVSEQSLDSLARQVASGRARVVTEEKSRLVDRAWSAVMGALGQLVGHNNHSEAHA
ncbi:DUF1631 domain-containing protein [Lysobacter auxotrophicus]|uniref:DUF1631 domain-containing protein n=1 Tax=Lysobacter auxotrophicus TaxID=2992573 RepID=A0ABM8DH59_9GAMM|nr:DUF1631 domain-containing protein [Lysobacter auxotrophicus]BDU17962.1 DUF1631 domain-containing protein [Lysobacter auxotrophicus]